MDAVVNSDRRLIMHKTETGSANVPRIHRFGLCGLTCSFEGYDRCTTESDCQKPGQMVSIPPILVPCSMAFP
jgi:hypothetical protein